MLCLLIVLVTKLDQDKLVLAEKIEILGKPARCYREMFEHALTFLANPHKIWKNGTFEDRRNVLKLAFTEKLKYSRISGLRTPEISMPFSVLGDFLGGEKVMAHWGGDT